MSKTPKIKNCPFCGQKAKIIQNDNMFYIICSGEKCFVSMGERWDRDAMPDHYFFSQEEAIKSWNIRNVKSN